MEYKVTYEFTLVDGNHVLVTPGSDAGSVIIDMSGWPDPDRSDPTRRQDISVTLSKDDASLLVRALNNIKNIGS